MYLCAVCHSPSKPGQPRKVHVIERDTRKFVFVTHKHGRPPEANSPAARREIAAEVPVCCDCDRMLRGGLYTYDELVQHYRSQRQDRPNRPPLPPRAKVNTAVTVGKVVTFKGAGKRGGNRKSGPDDTQVVPIEVMYRVEGDPVG